MCTYPVIISPRHCSACTRARSIAQVTSIVARSCNDTESSCSGHRPLPGVRASCQCLTTIFEFNITIAISYCSLRRWSGQKALRRVYRSVLSSLLRPLVNKKRTMLGTTVMKTFFRTKSICSSSACFRSCVGRFVNFEL